MAESLYSILMSMANNPSTLKKATKKARPKIRADYDKNVRKQMVQYYLDSYDPTSYKRIEPSPLFSAYKTRSKLVQSGTMVEVLVEPSGISLDGIYESNSYYHQEGGAWQSFDDIHGMTGKQYMSLVSVLHDEYDILGGSYGIVQGSWILENFEAGIHPRTNGWPRKKWSKKMKYRPKRDQFTPLEMAEKYADKYFNLDTSYQYILSELDTMWEEMFS